MAELMSNTGRMLSEDRGRLYPWMMYTDVKFIRMYIRNKM
jgi:hypothetical protein